MAVKLKNLERIAKTYTEQQNYLYKDLALDIQQSSLKEPGVNLPVPGVDIKVSFDFAAIRNSLQNLFNTLPGQRFLFPDYGLDLYQFLFLPITEDTGRIIGERILKTIQKYERRVTIQNINIRPDIDNNTYNITITLTIPLLQQTTTFEGQLNIKSQSFIFLPTSRNS